MLLAAQIIFAEVDGVDFAVSYAGEENGWVSVTPGAVSVLVLAPQAPSASNAANTMSATVRPDITMSRY